MSSTYYADLYLSNNSSHPLRNNINIVTMPTRDVLLRHFRKTYLYTKGHDVAHMSHVHSRGAARTGCSKEGMLVGLSNSKPFFVGLTTPG